MTRMAVLAVLTLSTVAMAQETGKRTAQDTRTQETIKKLEEDSMTAYVKRDVAFLERVLADEFVSTYPDGTVLDRKSELEYVKSGALALTEIKLSDLKVSVYGNTAVVTGRSTIKGKARDRDISGPYRFIDVFVKRGDRWQCVAGQITAIAKP